MNVLIKELPPLPSGYKHFLSSNKTNITKGERGVKCHLCKNEKMWKNVTWKTVDEKAIKNGWIMSTHWVCKKCSIKNNINWINGITWFTPDNRFEFNVTLE